MATAPAFPFMVVVDARLVIITVEAGDIDMVPQPA